MAYDSSLLQDKIRTPQQLALYAAKVLSSITLETGFVESEEKFKNLQDTSLSADTTAKKVDVFQRLAKLAKKRGALQTKSAIANGAAFEFHCSVEDPSSAYCITSEAQQEFEEELTKPRFNYGLLAFPVALSFIGYLYLGD